MSIFSSILGGIGSALGLGSSVANTISQNQAAAQNFQYQQDALNWQKEAQQIAWNREDTAVQRRAADLEAAGLSKTLAAGSAASSSNPVKIDAPQRQANKYNVNFDALQQMQMVQDFANAKAQNTFILEQAKKVEEERKLLESQRKVYNKTYQPDNDDEGTQPLSSLGKLSKDLRNNSRLRRFSNRPESLGYYITNSEFYNKSKDFFKNAKDKVVNVFTDTSKNPYDDNILLQ